MSVVGLLLVSVGMVGAQEVTSNLGSTTISFEGNCSLTEVLANDIVPSTKSYLVHCAEPTPVVYEGQVSPDADGIYTIQVEYGVTYERFPSNQTFGRLEPGNTYTIEPMHCPMSADESVYTRIVRVAPDYEDFLDGYLQQDDLRDAGIYLETC